MMSTIKWPEYFIEFAKTAAIKSKDPHTKVGCVIADKDNHIISTGFNGFPTGMEETEARWQRPEKYKWVIHAEINCIIHCADLSKAHTLACTLYPCRDCAKAIAATKIKRVYYEEHTIGDKDYRDPVSKEIFELCGIEVERIKRG